MAVPNGLMPAQDRRRPDPRQQEFATGAPRQREGAMTPPAPTSPGAMAPDRQAQAMVPKVPGGGRNGLMVPRGTAGREGSDPAPPASATTPAPVTMDREGNAVPGVSGRLHTLLQSDSPYIKRARTKAKQYANRRGLMNSSIAAGAGETAAIDAALPIAQADASIAAGERGLRSTEAMREADRELSKVLQERDHRVQQLMQTERIDHDTAMQQANREMQQSIAAAERRAAAARQRAALSHASQEAARSREFQSQVARDAAQRDINARYNARVNAIAQNTNIPAEERRAQEDHAAFVRDQEMEASGKIFDYEPTWTSGRRPEPEEAEEEAQA